MGRTHYLAGLCLLLAMSLGQAQSPSSSGDHSDIAVLVNPSNPVNELTTAELRRMLMGDRMFWGGNVKVRLVLGQPGTWERDQVLNSLLKIKSAEFDRVWLQRVFRGEALDVPLSVSSTALAERYLISTPGGMTFIRSKNSPHDLKVLRLDGKLPGDTGYVLR